MKVINNPVLSVTALMVCLWVVPLAGIELIRDGGAKVQTQAHHLIPDNATGSGYGSLDSASRPIGRPKRSGRSGTRWSPQPPSSNPDLSLPSLLIC